MVIVSNYPNLSAGVGIVGTTVVIRYTSTAAFFMAQYLFN
jgi:hypothetical protein